MQRLFYTLTLCSVIFAIGCGSSTVNIKGTVKMADGSPVDRGVVYLVSEKEQFTIDIQSNGAFSYSVSPGIYRISVGGITREEVQPNSDYPVQVSLVAEKYENPATSELGIDTSQTKTIELVLDPAE